MGKHDREKDLEGGYILKHDNDNIDKGDLTFTIGSNSRRSKFPLLKMVMVYPKGNQDEMEPELTFAKQWLDAFEAALVSDEWTDPEVGWRRFADEDSFIDYFLGVEMTKNPDAYRGSTYMHKDCGGLLAMGPMWDYNEAFGVAAATRSRGTTTAVGAAARVGAAPSPLRAGASTSARAVGDARRTLSTASRDGTGACGTTLSSSATSATGGQSFGRPGGNSIRLKWTSLSPTPGT